MNLSRAEIVVVGNEILSGKRVDTNSAFLGRHLARIGVEVTHKTTIRDVRAEMLETLKRAMERSQLIVTSGGLGPTLDDLTRDILSEATGIGLTQDDHLAEQIRLRFERRGIPFSETNLCQARVPVRGGYYPNPNGTAPGLYFMADRKLLIALPGPPREMLPILLDHVIPHLIGLDPDLYVRSRRTYLIAGTGESNIDREIRRIVLPDDPVEISSLPRLGLVEVTFTLTGESDAEKRRLDEIAHSFEDAMGIMVVGDKEDSLETAIAERLIERGETLATAESCTGGLVGAKITSVPGSSSYFLGSIVAYHNAVKHSLLGVPEETLERHGAVSGETARAMALGVRKTLGADWGISITGIAGPAGGTEEKPVGLVYIGLSGPGTDRVERHVYPGDRETIRERSAVAAMDLLRRQILGA